MPNVTTAVQYDILNDGSVVKVATADFKGETIPVGTCIWDFTGLDRPGYLNLAIDHGLLQRSEYPQLWAAIEAMIVKHGSNSASIVLTDAAWLAEVTASRSGTNQNGTCGRFSRGDGSTTFRIPLIREAFVRTFVNQDYPQNLGRYELDQMRPITGIARYTFTDAPQAYEGAFRDGGDAGGSNVGGGNTAYRYHALAMNSSYLGGNFTGATTHPRNVAANLLMKVVDTTTATFQQGTYNLVPSTIPLRGQNGYSQDWKGAFPDDTRIVNISLPATGGVVTAPGNGWIDFRSTALAAGGFIGLFGSVSSVVHAYTAGSGLNVHLPVSSGDPVTVGYGSVTNSSFKFVPAKGTE